MGWRVLEEIDLMSESLNLWLSQTTTNKDILIIILCLSVIWSLFRIIDVIGVYLVARSK